MVNFVENLSQDYLDDTLVHLAHHSAGIDRNTIYHLVTCYCFDYLKWRLLTSLKATVREFYEIENPKQTFERMIKRLVNEDLLSIEIISDIHADLTNGW